MTTKNIFRTAMVRESIINGFKSFKKLFTVNHYRLIRHGNVAEIEMEIVLRNSCVVSIK